MNVRQISAEPSLTIRRTFAVPRTRVYAAWTDASLVRQWIAPEGNVSEIQWDAREGAPFRVVMAMPSGDDFVALGAFSEVRAPERLAFSFRWEEDDASLERETFITIDFVDRGSDTEMVFTQAGFRDDESRDRHVGGWTGSFENLARVALS